MDVHPNLSEQLRNIAQSGDFPHMLFYGPSGAGKKTRIMALLRSVFNASVEKMKIEHKTIKAGSSKEIVITSASSSYHIEVTPSDAGVYDRYVISTLIKEIAQSTPIEQTGQRGFKVVVINECDQLTREAQQALRRTMEKYMRTCRLILCATSTSKVMEPIRSRCLCIRVPLPSTQEITQVLHKIAKKENVALPNALAERIANSSDRNLRRAIMILEATKVEQQPLTDDTPIRLADWELFTADIAKDIIEEQSPKRILETREKFYKLIANCIPPDMIIRKLALELLKKLDSELKHEVIHWAAFYEHQLKCGSRAIFHLEAFVAKFMCIYKRFILSTF